MPADDPNRWALLHGDAQSYIVLTTALLGISATFADDLLEDEWGRWIAAAAWSLLVLSIIGAMKAKGGVVYGLNGDKTPSEVGRTLNRTIYVVLAGAAMLAVGAWRSSVPEAADARRSPVALARATVAEMTRDDAGSIVVEALRQVPGHGYELLVVAGSERFEVVVDADGDEVISALPASPAP